MACAASAEADNLLTVYARPPSVASAQDANGEPLKLWQYGPETDTGSVQWSSPEPAGKPLLLPDGWYRVRLVDRPPGYEACRSPAEKVVQVKSGQPTEVTLIYLGQECL